MDQPSLQATNHAWFVVSSVSVKDPIETAPYESQIWTNNSKIKCPGHDSGVTICEDADSHFEKIIETS